MATSNGPSIWWLIPGVVFLLGVMGKAIESGDTGQTAVAWVIVGLFFGVPAVGVYRFAQWVNKRNSKAPGQSQ